MLNSELDILQRRIKRERLARKEAENILEQKSLELFEANQKLNALNNELQSEVDRRIKQLEFAEHEYQELVEAVNDIIYKTDIRGRFLYVNPKTVEVTGYTEEEFMRLRINDIIDPSFEKEVTTYYLKQVELDLPAKDMEFPIVTKSGDRIWINQTANFVFNAYKERNEFIVVARDVTERRNLTQVLKNSEEKYRGIIENLELGLLEIDVKGAITRAYPKFCELCGYEEQELIGLNAREVFLHDEDKTEANEDGARKFASVCEVRIRHKNGNYLWVIVSNAPFYDIRGVYLGSIGIYLNISQRKAMESELKIAKEVAEASVKSKEMFLANMSHEIRTPMNAILGLGNLLTETLLTDQQYRYASTINTSAKNLLTIINDILDFSKIEAGKLQIENIPLDVMQTVDKTVEVFLPLAKDKKLHFVRDLDKKIRKEVLGDPTRLNQVLINLLGNAFKFTEEGEIVLKVELLEKDKKNYKIRFSVRDTGIGISQKHQNSIFDSFAQAEPSTARLFGGTGLGLSISYQLIKLMGGDLKVKSKVGEGTEFSFELDLEILKFQAMVNNVSVEKLPKGVRVLLVEDNKVNQFLAQTILKSWECEVVCADDGEIAIEKLNEASFDIVLMDVRMPNMNGEEATKVIREEMCLNIPIIALTANAIKGDKEKYLSMGMNDYVSKPFEKDELNEKILKWIK